MVGQQILDLFILVRIQVPQLCREVSSDQRASLKTDISRNSSQLGHTG